MQRSSKGLVTVSYRALLSEQRLDTVSKLFGPKLRISTSYDSPHCS